MTNAPRADHRHATRRRQPQGVSDVTEPGRVAIELLGQPRLRVGDTWRRLEPDRGGQLLAYLAYAGERIERSRIADLLWGDQSLDGAFRNLRRLLYDLRRREPDIDVAADRDSLTWCVPCDARDLHAALEAGDAARAVAAYRGPLLPGFEDRAGGAYGHWLEVEREHLRLRWRAAALEWARGVARTSEAALVPGALKGLIDDDLDEEALVVAVEALEHLGEGSRAHLLADRFRRQVLEAFGVEPGPVVRALAARGAPVAAGPVGDLATPWGGGPFLGREEEVDACLSWLNAGERLLTFTGPGGAGKSRLAHVIAARVAPAGAGVLTIDAAGAREPRDVVSAVAAATSAVVDASEAMDAVLERVLPRDVAVLVIDDVEAESAVAEAVTALLRSRPSARLLVTAASPLRLPEERVVPLEGLDHGGEADLEPEAARTLPAVALFAALAERHEPGFTLMDADLDAVRAIASAVDGSPLGLELAAPWVRSLAIADLAAHVTGDPDFLASPTRSSTRHRSLRAAFEHAVGLLRPSQRVALSRLAIFTAPFSREGAAVVGEVPLPVLASLVDRSLVRVGADHRFELPAPVRAFAREALAADAKAERSTRARLVSYALHVVRDGIPEDGFPNALAFARAGVEHAHLLAACGAAADLGRVDDLTRLASAVALLSELRGRVEEAEDVVVRALAAFPADGRRVRGKRARLLAQRAWLVHWHEPGTAAALAATALEALAPSDGTGRAWALRASAMAAWRTGAYADAEAQVRLALEVVERHGPISWRAVLLDGLGLCLSARGAVQAAERAFAEALAINERFDDPFQATQNLVNLASQARRRGAVRTAAAYAQRALDLARSIGYDQYVPHALAQVAACTLAGGDVAAAATAAEDAVAIAQRAGDGYVRIWSLLVAGEAGVLAGNAGAAATLATGVEAALAAQDRKQLLQGVSGIARVAVARRDVEVAALAVATARHAPASPALLRRELAPVRADLARAEVRAAARIAARRVGTIGVEGAARELTALVRGWATSSSP